MFFMIPGFQLSLFEEKYSFSRNAPIDNNRLQYYNHCQSGLTISFDTGGK